MGPGDLIVAALAAALGAGAIAWLSDAWSPPRCRPCDEPAVEADADVPTPHALIAVIEYRCPTCHRFVDRRYLVTGD